MATTKQFHIAPMLDVSTTEFLHFVRILSKRCILWTEMIVDETLWYSQDVDHHLSFSKELSPIICQIGGRTPEYIAKGVEQMEMYGYDEVNLNIDCPSSRVSGKRKFGAILMHDKETAYEVVQAMNENTKEIPISVKTRVGIELEDGEAFDTMDHLIGFIEDLRSRGCYKFYIHARKCVIGGLSPAQNRLVPPLNYPRVYELCNNFPDCEFILNGGIPGLAASKLICKDVGEETNSNCESSIKMQEHVVPCKVCNASNGSCTVPPNITPPNLTGVMLGRAVMDNPSMFWDIDRYFYGEANNPCKNRRQVLEQYCDFLNSIYSRRCCDSEETVTSKIPSPKFQMFVESGGCNICKSYHGEPKYITNPTEINKSTGSKMKITSRVIDRSLRPILGIFFGCRMNKGFRRECDRLSRDKSIRNCGPAFIIKKAISTMPAELLDMPFTKTEDIDNSSLNVFVGPTLDGCQTFP
ncbi:FMN-linked oxidoreductase [Chaetoceros tenuissimus]|uniref:FMN-linked oxidoreductase n=1 Tax=Chaetoceros tenuissimus TaxID=426638 RepID=A0AAD3HDH2_9STRA|nr:FMN-linked oxidoreductase [Chaetoceros tenuissimus]